MFSKAWELKIFLKQTHVDLCSADVGDAAVKHCRDERTDCTKGRGYETAA